MDYQRENLFGGHHAKKLAMKAGATKAEAKAAAKKSRKANSTQILNAAKTALINAGEAPIFAPILPFVPMMKNRLSSHNISTDGTIHDIARKFVKEIISKGSTFEETFYHADAGEMVGDAASVGAAVATENPVAFVKAILKWIKDLGKKKKLSPEDAKSKADAETAAHTVMATAPKNGFFDKILRLLGLKKKLPVT
jgi:hypothetical protein